MLAAVLAGSGAAGLAGLLGKRSEFSRSLRQAPVFYALVAAGTLGGAALTLLSVDPVQLLVISAFINGLAVAPSLIVVLLIARDRAIMGGHVNGRLANTLGWATVILMTGTAAITVYTAPA